MGVNHGWSDRLSFIQWHYDLPSRAPFILLYPPPFFSSPLISLLPTHLNSTQLNSTQFHSLPGGENISSIEVEAILLTHHMIDEAAVIAVADEKWGEVPCAFVTLRTDSGVQGLNSGSIPGDD
jgi:AMP-binding enzyme C-terminal domain